MSVGVSACSGGSVLSPVGTFTMFQFYLDRHFWIVKGIPTDDRIYRREDDES